MVAFFLYRCVSFIVYLSTFFLNILLCLFMSSLKLITFLDILSFSLRPFLISFYQSYFIYMIKSNKDVMMLILIGKLYESWINDSKIVSKAERLQSRYSLSFNSCFHISLISCPNINNKNNKADPKFGRNELRTVF